MEQTAEKPVKTDKPFFHRRAVEDIRYRGPFTYQVFLALGWVCIVLSQIAVILRLFWHFNPDIKEPLESLAGVFLIVFSYLEALYQYLRMIF